MTELPTLNVVLNSEDDTHALAARLADLVQAGDVVLLFGTLGMGKSAFSRALIRSRAEDDFYEVPSPTFTLVQVYDELGEPALWHFDLYRLSEPEEAYELDIEDAFADGVSLIEWPDRLEYLTPEERLELHFEPGPTPDARSLTLTGVGARGHALIEALS